MKKIFVIALSALTSLAFADNDKVLESIKPNAQTGKAAKTAVAWQNDNDAALAKATADGRLAAFVKDEASAKALLSKVKGAYLTDPMAAITIAAVSQYVVKPCKSCCLEKARAVWTKALIDTARSATDAYVAQFCIDQLRWCGCPSQAKLVREAAAGKSGEVVALAEMAAKELEGKSLGR